MSKRPLSYEELVYYLENNDSDLDILSEDDYGWEVDSHISEGAQFEMDEPETPDLEPEQNEVFADVSHVPVQEQADVDVEMAEPSIELINPQQVSINEISQKEPTASKTARINLYYIENELTQKKFISWRRNVQYLTPNIIWFHPMTIHPVELESPLYFFRQYITSDLFNLMVENTNLYAVQQHARFSPTCQGELESFVALHILMGNLNYPRVRCYWENKLRIPMIADAMARDRFFKLRKHLHFVNVQEKPPECRDRLWKVRPLYDTLRSRMLELPLETVLCIDEQMIPFKGQINTKQYVKGKPTPWGIKLFALCGTSGIMYDFIIYQGSTTELAPDQQEVFGLGASVVLKLTERINEKNVQLYFDNYFSNYNILQYLRNRNIYVAGTARIERFKNPPFSKDSEMKKKGRGAAEELISGDPIQHHIF